MKNRIKSYVALLIICTSILFSSTAAYGATPLEEAKYILDVYYVDYLNEQALQAKSMEELLDAIGDPYTTYMSPEAFQQFMESVENEFSGIGVMVEQAQDGILIIFVVPNSGAEKAGLQPGDIILEAGGRPLKGMDISEALTYIKGEAGTFVDLKIQRGSQQFDLKVQRTFLDLPTVEGALLEGNIAYIRVSTFGSNTSEEFKRCIMKMEQKNPKGYIIDVRSNGGGYVDTALMMVGYFIGENVAMVTSNKWGVNEYISPEGDIRINRPVFLLVDMFSASASEILAGALQDYGKALLIGTTTYGKGTMQTLFPLSNKGVLKVTTNYTYTPVGRVINELGLEPDIKTGEEADPYYAALLLLYGDAENKQSKKEYMAIEIDGDIYDIDINQARRDEYWESYGAIINDSLIKGRDIFIGTMEGWKKFEPQRDIHKYYFPDYEEMPRLTGIEPDKVFSIKFSRPVNIDTLEGKIHLIDSSTGESIDCQLVETDSHDIYIKVKAKQLLTRGREYYLVMDKGIKSKDGYELQKGVLCRAAVMK